MGQDSSVNTIQSLESSLPPSSIAPVNVMMKGHLSDEDEDIIQHVRRSESPEEEEKEDEDDNEEQRISHLDASLAFQVCIDWLHQQSEGEPNQILQLRRLQRTAHLKYSNSLKQTHITDFSH